MSNQTSATSLASKQHDRQSKKIVTLNQLTKRVTQTSQALQHAMQIFYDQATYSLAERTGQAENVIAMVDKLLAESDWQSSHFLRATMKSIQKTRNKFYQELCDLKGQDDTSILPATLSNSKKTTVYILLYQVQGHDLNQWIKQLKNIGHYTQGRPIYYEEAHAQRVIANKLEQSHDAYAIVSVDTDKLSNHQLLERQDKWGNPLLSLPANVVNEQHVKGLVYLHKHYQYEDGQLTATEQISE